MNPQDFLALATEILPHLSGQWNALADGEYSYPRISFEAPEHPGWAILMRMHWRGQRFDASGGALAGGGHRNGHGDSTYMRELFCPSAGYQAIDASAEVRQDEIKLSISLPLHVAEPGMALGGQ